ncbi:MAG TPA: PAS domain S-box protein [Burkholderiales bacterium]|jgi:PAS domain S-box-containing protein|nr:PAS domain S-box protein [Burkholderiales bacterium]
MSDIQSGNPLELSDPYRRLVHDVQDYAIFLLDRSGHIVSWNRGAERLKGYAAAEIIGRNFSVLYPPDAIERRWPERELKMAQESGRLEDEGWRVRKDGSRFWANVVITALHDESGALRGFSKITRDLTERRNQEETLRQSEQRFRVLVDGLRDYAIFMLDTDGRVTSWNSGAQRITGYTAEEIRGQHFSVFYPRAAIDRKLPEQELAMAREHGRFEDEGPRLRKDGTTFWANVVVSPFYDHEGVLMGYANVARDLTDRKRAESLEQAERRTSEFLAMLAHELRNPLAPINNALHLLALKPPADATEKWVREVLHRQTAQITRLIDDLLDVSRITRAAIPLDGRPLDVRAVVRAAVEGSMQWIQARGHALSIELPPNEALTVLADEVRLTQVLHKLLHNAARYTPEGGQLSIGARREASEVVICVKDNGVGMDAELLRSAFDLFKQGQPAVQRPQGGLGIGLTLVQRLVRLHGGTVEARSAGVDRGSEFTVRLPVAHEQPASAAADERASSTPRRVLVIDDNSDAANALRMLLENDGHSVRVAHDGVSGLALAREYRPEYLLLDIGLPRLNGYDIAASVRGDPELKDTTIVAITGYGQVHDRARTAAVGFDHHLTKPVEFTALQELFRAKA